MRTKNEILPFNFAFQLTVKHDQLVLLVEVLLFLPAGAVAHVSLHALAPVVVRPLVLRPRPRERPQHGVGAVVARQRLVLLGLLGDPE